MPKDCRPWKRAPVKVLAAAFFFASELMCAEEPFLTMAYKPNEKLPYIAAAPDNAGLYRDLLSRALDKIGYTLKIERLPKRRLYHDLELGAVDLYSSSVFRESRVDFLFYIPNGLVQTREYYGITARDIPELASIGDINKYGLEWWEEGGTTKSAMAKKFGVQMNKIKNPSIGKAVKAIAFGRPAFFRVKKKELDEYLNHQNLTSYDQLPVKVHQHCCIDRDSKRYTAFSRKSPHFQERANPHYNKDKLISPDNFPTVLVEGSVPFRLREALQEMIDEGEIKLLLKKYKLIENTE